MSLLKLFMGPRAPAGSPRTELAELLAKGSRITWYEPTRFPGTRVLQIEGPGQELWGSYSYQRDQYETATSNPHFKLQDAAPAFCALPPTQQAALLLSLQKEQP